MSGEASIQALGFDRQGVYVFVILGRLLKNNKFNFSGLADIKNFLVTKQVKYRLICVAQTEETVNLAGKLFSGIFSEI